MSTRSDLRNEITMSWDGDDPWGSVLSALGGVCDVLDYVGEDERIPASAGYRAALSGPNVEDYPASMFVELLDDEVIDLEALEYWARVLSRFADLVPEDQQY